MSSAKTATASVLEILPVSDSGTADQRAAGRKPAQVVVFPERRAGVLRRAIPSKPAWSPAPAAIWTATARMDPTRRLIHDFRNTVQELVYAVERADRTAIAGLSESLDGYLFDALYGPKRVA